jgi:cell division GTPase FtsZ
MEAAMFDFVIGLGQGGGRLGKVFGEVFSIPSVIMNLTGVDFTHMGVSKKDIFVIEEGGTGRDPKFGESCVRNNYDEVVAFLKRPTYSGARYICVCVGGGGGAGTGFMFPILDLLLSQGKEIFLIYTLPESKEGIPTIPNALASLDRVIAKYLQKEKISVLLIDNEYCIKRYGHGKTFDYWGSVNKGVVASLRRFWLLTELERFAAFIDVASGHKALDKNDIRRVLFSKSGYTDLRQMSLTTTDPDSLMRMVKESSLIFGSLDIRTTKQYVISVGIPRHWKDLDGTLELVENIFQTVSKATKHTPDVIRCSYFNAKLDAIQVSLLLSGMAKGRGIDKMIRSAEKDWERLESKGSVERLNIENIVEK